MRDAGYGVIVGFQMEEKIEQAYLYDFYGELLNEHHALTKQFHESHDEAVIVEIEQISNQILEEL